MDNKQIFLALLISFVISLAVIGVLPLVSAANITLTNFSNLTTTVSVTCGFTGTAFEGGIQNVSLYYNNTVTGSVSTGNDWRGTLLTTITTNDTATNTTFTNSSISLASLTEGRGTFFFWCQGHNSTNFTNIVDATGNSTVARNITIDNTAPSVVTVHTAYDNATAKKNTDTLIFNISVTDGLFLGTNTPESACVVNIYGSANSTAAANQTIPVIMDSGSTTTGTCNTSTLNLTGAADDVYLMEIYINDTANNVARNNTNTLYLVIDTTDPTASASCSPTSVQTGESFPCSCSSSDGLSGVNSTTTTSTSPDGTASPSNTGTFTYTCTVEDNAVNSASSTATYTVEQTGTSGSAAPGTGAGAAGATTTPHLWTKITPGAATVKKYTDPELGVKEIQIEVKNEAQNVRVTVTKYDSKPAEVSVAKTGKVNQYIQIETENLADSLDKATVTIQVEKSWVSEQGLERDDVALFKFDEDSGEWNEQATAFSEEDDTYYYYEAELASFSFFAIGEKVIVTEDGEEVGVSEDRAAEEAEEAAAGAGLTWLWILIVVIIVVVIVGVVVKQRKK